MDQGFQIDEINVITLVAINQSQFKRNKNKNFVVSIDFL
jgi:hypothetical protein